MDWEDAPAFLATPLPVRLYNYYRDIKQLFKDGSERQKLIEKNTGSIARLEINLVNLNEAVSKLSARVDDINHTK